MPSRLYITLTPDERRGLDEISQEALRDPREQLRYLLRQHLAERGMLPICDQAEPAAQNMTMAEGQEQCVVDHKGFGRQAR